MQIWDTFNVCPIGTCLQWQCTTGEDFPWEVCPKSLHECTTAKLQNLISVCVLFVCAGAGVKALRSTLDFACTKYGVNKHAVKIGNKGQIPLWTALWGR